MHIARLDYVFSLILFSSFALAADGPSIPPPPATRKVEVTETLHGVTISDPYRWLEDQESADTRKWIDDQNAFTHSIIDQYPGRDELKKQLSSLLRIDTIGTPSHRGERYFFTRRKADQN